MENNFFKMFLGALLIIAQTSFAQQTESVSTSTATVAPSASTTDNTDPKPPVVHSSNFEDSSPKTFGVSLFTIGGVTTDQFKRENPSLYIYDAFLALTYKVNKDLRLAARTAFNYSTEGLDYQGKEVTNKLTGRDFSLVATRYNVLEDVVSPKLQLLVMTRLFLPTSEGSKAEGMIARLRFKFEGKYYFDRYSNLRTYWIPSYYFQRTTAYLDSNNKIKTTNLGDSQQGAELDWNLNKYFSIKPGFEFEDTWLNESEVNNRGARHYTTIAYRMGVEVRPIKAANFTIGYQDRRDFIQTAYNETSVSLMTNVRFY